MDLAAPEFFPIVRFETIPMDFTGRY